MIDHDRPSRVIYKVSYVGNSIEAFEVVSNNRKQYKLRNPSTGAEVNARLQMLFTDFEKAKSHLVSANLKRVELAERELRSAQGRLALSRRYMLSHAREET